MILVNVKCQLVEEDYISSFADFIALVKLEWHIQNKVGNIGILLQRICEHFLHYVFFEL